MSTTIFHNPKCGTSRNVLGLIRNAGIEPTVVEYLKTPPDHAALRTLLQQLQLPARAILREKGTPYAELDLGNPKWSEEELIDFIVQHPILLQRPIVVTPKGAALCRPSEKVLEILDQPQQGAFSKEDGEPVVDASGQLVCKD
ncbi:arsenate reductase (glutaredoxin) [Brachymonas denitrificans]|jgi:arsenate reductase|uniref:Arsenate reductase n=1 Tax=Brachymonas denitrificans DSM 15123 TaxID=1121117 RepID=A0A1H8CX13_9BURK|nr:arsenate reductase (glutaredoxin) [Brachymonas denitrificans]SEM99540.1 arsenate reductase [Brachymonas denitrificans DSM 15123]